MSRLSVTRTNSVGGTGGGGRTVLVLGGHLEHGSLPGLLAQVRAEAQTDVARIVLDMSALVACDREPLLELARQRGRLEERPECVLDVVGARWPQFVAVLAGEPVQNLDAIRAVIRELRRPIILDPCRPRVREVTEGLVAASMPEPRGSVAQHRPESGADLAARGTRGHDH